MDFDEYGNFLGELPEECVTACSHSGDCFDDVVFWVSELNFNVPTELAKKYLEEFGCWEDLDTCDQDTLNVRVLWIACGDIKETGDWYGVLH
jgi:hypothetical protein